MIKLDQDVRDGVTVLHFRGSLTQEEVASIEPSSSAASSESSGRTKSRRRPLLALLLGQLVLP